MSLHYRADIDGLRAIAILSVVCFHAGLGLVSGGYAGVDIFFVISGFLITSIITNDLQAGKFSIGTFYERRIRRIVPALFVMIITTVGVGWLWFEPKAFAALCKSAIAASLFSSNFLFNAEAGYFDAPSELKPLLHTWSLAVEEQFYLLAPMILALLMRHGRMFTLCILVLAGVTSLAMATKGVLVENRSAFYLLDSRAWELILGAVLAIARLPSPSRHWMAELAGLTGLGMMLYAVFGFTEHTPFPGITALVPCLGAALVIHAGSVRTTLVSRLLSLRLPVFIGLISYPLYLWHWPVIVFSRYYLILPPNLTHQLSMIMTALLLATMSWRFLESPIRSRQWLGRRPSIFTAFAMTLLVTIGTSLFVIHSQGLPGRFPPQVLASQDIQQGEWQQWYKCEDLKKRLARHEPFCTLGQPGRSAVFALWGDSHAAALAPGIHDSASRIGITGVSLTQSGCHPFINHLKDQSSEQLVRDCLGRKKIIFNYLENHPEISTVIMAALWSGLESKYPGDQLLQALDKEIDTLTAMNKRVIIVQQVPYPGFHAPSVSFQAHLLGKDPNTLVGLTAELHRKDVEHLVTLFRQLENRHPGMVTIIDPGQRLCGDGLCRVTTGDHLLYWDAYHLTPYGSRYIAGGFDAAMQQIQSRQP